MGSAFKIYFSPHIDDAADAVFPELLLNWDNKMQMMTEVCFPTTAESLWPNEE